MNLIMPRAAKRCVRWGPPLLLALCAIASVSLADEPRHDFLVFPYTDTLDTFDESDPGVADNSVRPGLSALYSYDGGSFRFLGEYLMSSSEHELERFKLGWKSSENTMWWLGRFHSTSKFWVTEYHHGQFMQTSITRPSVEGWEDESGPSPSHLTGIEVEHTIPLPGEKSWSLDFSAGLAPKFGGDELRPWDLLDPDSGHGLSYDMRAGYRGDIFGDAQIGIIASWNDIQVDQDSTPALTGLEDIQQLTYGIFGSWRWQELRLLGSFVQFDQKLRYDSGPVDDEFLSGYLQAEYELSNRWTVFSRIDYSSAEDDSPYLALLPMFVSHRHMLGLRFDFHDHHALTVEVADSSVRGDDTSHRTFKEVRLQWSAAYP